MRKNCCVFSFLLLIFVTVHMQAFAQQNPTPIVCGTQNCTGNEICYQPPPNCTGTACTNAFFLPYCCVPPPRCLYTPPLCRMPINSDDNYCPFPKPEPTCTPPPACVYANPPCNLQLTTNAVMCEDGSFTCGRSVCTSGQECYQPPMPTCPAGLGCVQVMPEPICRNRISPTLGSCTRKSNGDANCDDSVNDTDYSIWKNYYLGLPVATCPYCSADFNSQNGVNLVDFEIWRSGMYDPVSITMPPPPP